MAGNVVSRRKFITMLAVTLPGAMGVACAGKGNPAPTAAGSGQPAAAPPGSSVTGTFRFAFDNETETRNPVVEAFFQKNYPNMKVSFEVTPDGYFEKLLAQIASGDVPDLAYIHESQFLNFAVQGALLPLDDYMAKMPLIGGAEQYPLEVLKPNNYYNGKWYTFPYGFSVLFVRYNKDMFRKEGLTLPDEKWTWTSFLEAAAAMTKDPKSTGTPEQWGWIGWTPGWMPAQWPLMQSYGASHFNEARDQCIINNDAGVQILDMMHSTFCGDTRCSPTPAAKAQLAAGTARLFEGGLAAMDSCMSENVASSLQNIAGKFEMGIEMYPAGPKGSFVRAGGSSVALPKGDKHPEIAWELVRYLSGDEEANRIAATYKEGNPLTRLDYMLKYNVPAGPLAEQQKRIMTDGFKKYGTVVQYGPIGEYSRIWASNVDKLATCEVTARQCADAIADEANKVLKEVKQG